MFGSGQVETKGFPAVPSECFHDHDDDVVIVVVAAAAAVDVLDAADYNLYHHHHYQSVGGCRERGREGGKERERER